MEVHYGQTPKPDFDVVIQPIFDALRRNKISSFYQLRRIPENGPKTNIFCTIQQRPPHGNQVMRTHNRQSSSPVDNSHPKFWTIAEMGNTTEMGFRRGLLVKKTQDPQKNGFALNLNLKIKPKPKRHLIDKIDLDEIEKHLHKNRQCETRYSHFMKMRLQNRNNEQRESMELAKTKYPKTYRQPQRSLTPLKTHYLELELQGKHEQKAITARDRTNTNVAKKFWVKSMRDRGRPQAAGETSGNGLGEGKDLFDD